MFKKKESQSSFKPSSAAKAEKKEKEEVKENQNKENLGPQQNQEASSDNEEAKHEDPQLSA